MIGDDTIRLAQRIRRARATVNESRAVLGKTAYATREAEATLAYLQKRGRILFR